MLNRDLVVLIKKTSPAGDTSRSIRGTLSWLHLIKVDSHTEPELGILLDKNMSRETVDPFGNADQQDRLSGVFIKIVCRVRFDKMRKPKPIGDRIA